MATATDQTLIKVWLIGPDEPGIVYRIALVLKNHGGSIVRLRSMQFADRFALTLIASFPEHARSAASAAVSQLLDNPLGPAFEIFAGETETYKRTKPGSSWVFTFKGPDRMGVVEHFAYQFSKRELNLEAVMADTDPTVHDAMSGALTFKSAFHATVPDDVDIALLLEDLEREAIEIGHTFDHTSLP